MFGLSAGAAAALGAGAATIGSALIGADAAGDAADAQAASTAKSIEEQRRQFDLQRTDGAPYREAGANALQQLMASLRQPVTAADAMSDPGYEFGRQQGQLGLDRKFAATGGRVSGAAMKAASRYNTDYAASGYGAAYQRRQDALNRLASVAGIGQTATNASAAAGSQSAANIGNLLTGQGNAEAGARMAQGSTWANTGNQLAAMYQRYQMPPISGYYSSMATPDVGGMNGGFGWKNGVGGM
jgi:hypothetical protein